ncbi:MAG: hypothetical protein MJ091_06560, partial [Clostridia bacterium]|nr:hypothetical protein [Clostridia bacterium]
MKRFLSVLLVLSLLFCFASCGGEETVDSSSNVSGQNKPDESTQSQPKTDVEISENISLQYDDVYRFEGADEIVSEDPSVVKKALYAE